MVVWGPSILPPPTPYSHPLHTRAQTSQQVLLLIPVAENTFKLSSKCPIDYLKQLNGFMQQPETYSFEKTGGDIVPSSNPDSPLVSFDVWSNPEEGTTNNVLGSFAPDKEQFTTTTENASG